MRPAAGRLLLIAALFVGWLGYLGYLVWTRPRTPDGQPLVLSRPQLLVSNVDVVAAVDDPAQPVVIKQVLSPPGDKDLHPGDRIEVPNIKDCRPLPPGGPNAPAPPDWTGPGDYLLPLERYTEDSTARYRVAPTPPSPGYPHRRPRIYPATPEALAQYREVRKPG
jgi:hypothetical protein